jgi:hypothetical protein
LTFNKKITILPLGEIMTKEQLLDHRRWIDRQIDLVDKVTEGDLIMTDQDRVERIATAYFALVNVTNGVILDYLEEKDEYERNRPAPKGN